MSKELLHTPVLFLIFNRPNTTIQVFEQIRKIKPAHLYVAADGPRDYKFGEKEITDSVKQIVLSGIDWECKVKTLFRDENLGCGKAVSQAIDWFFENVEEGIILEDDTLPDLSFFNYCESMLKKYNDNEQVMHISGCYFFKNYESILPNSPSYYFSKHIHVWGWATWKRAWQNYSFLIKNFKTENNDLKNYYGRYSKFWSQVYSETYENKIDTWDYQWMYTVFLNNGIAINPTSNLIKNIGFDEYATHTKNSNSIYNSIPTDTIHKIIHPNKIKIDKRRDELYYKEYLNIMSQNKWMLKNTLKKLYKRIVGEDGNLNYEISFKELSRLKVLPRFKTTETIFMGRKFCVPDAPTFLSSYHEIICEEIYKFNSNESSPVILDCGANIGLATLYFKIHYPGAKVLAFEPDPNIFAALKNNIELHNFEGVELFNEAIGHKQETLLFNMEGGHSGMLVNNVTDRTVPVRVTPLKDVLAKFDQVEFLKIDIEGHEINVLPTIAHELKKVKNLFLEYHTFIDEPQGLSTIIKIIEEAGFRYYLKDAANKKNPFVERELFYKMDMLVNIFCYR
jgi:FkbM family methyltransferase